MPYSLPEGYVERLGAPQSYDEGGDATWQREVYATARILADVLGLQTVLDFGCGSGFKLMQYFGDRDTLGVDLAPAVNHLRSEYPNRRWHVDEGLLITIPGPDLLICSDVIEHVDDPDKMCDRIKHIGPKWLVISTPDRKLMEKYPKWGRHLGPPANGCHVREWSFDEFGSYIHQHFSIVRHWHTNVEQCTQAVIAVLRP
jgi:SAM-dependent methyltransferase